MSAATIQHGGEHEAASVLRWVKPPQQARTREALVRLLDAAEQLVAEKGFDETPIVEIARRAGSSVGGFYRRFADKDGLLQAMHERFCEEARVTTDDALDPRRWEGAEAAEILREVTSFVVQIYREREGLFRAFLHRGVVNEEVQRRQEELFEYLSDALERLLADRTDDITHPDPELGVRFGLRVLLGTLDDTIAVRTSAPALDDERLVTELARMITRYLGVSDAQLDCARGDGAQDSTKRRKQR